MTEKFNGYNYPILTGRPVTIAGATVDYQPLLRPGSVSARVEHTLSSPRALALFRAQQAELVSVAQESVREQFAKLRSGEADVRQTEEFILSLLDHVSP